MADSRQILIRKFHSISPRCLTVLILSFILLTAAFIRLVNLGISPPGLNQDEAANAWNAYCLLKTGKDQTGQSWPIFYMHALGGNRTPLYIYLLLPFQAIGGLNIYTTRLPSVLGGVLTVAIIFFIGKRLFNPTVGLLAAGLLALSPWHVQQSRWGHEGNLSALLSMIPLAMLLMANMPVSDDEGRQPRPIWGALAGAATGIICYGYHSVRIFVPIFLFGSMLVVFTGWWHCFKTRKGSLAIIAFVVAFMATFGPLAWQHIFHPEGIARHVQYQEKLWVDGGPFMAIKNIALRYIRHFGFGFLFLYGDRSMIHSPPKMGLFDLYMFPLMIAGFVSILCRFRYSRAARILFVLVLIYPIGDSFFGVTYGLHALRCQLGLCGMVLLAAVGGAGIGRWLWKRKKVAALTAVLVFIVVVIGFSVRSLSYFFGEYNQQIGIYHYYHCDLVEACQWLRPRFKDVDAVFCTTDTMNQPYIVTLVAIGYDPDQWFRDEREFYRTDNYEFDLYTRYGKMYFVYGSLFEPAIANLLSSNRQSRMVFIVRPNELGFGNPVHKIFRPDGYEVLRIYER